MTKQELRTARNQILSMANKKCRELEVQYALEHNPVKIGDVIEHTRFPKKIIKVQNITIPDYGKFGTPECIYQGYVIDSNSGKEHDDITAEMYQSHVNKINNIPYKYKAE